MEEILQKLLNHDMLNEETRAELKEAFTSMIQEAREQVELQVRSELAEAWAMERDKIVDSIDLTVTDFLERELSELKEDIASFRDLEAEYAARLVEEKKQIAASIGADLDQLSTKLDAFVEKKLQEELDELKESIKQAQENEFGRKVFEAFKKEFGSVFNDEDTLLKQLSVAESRLREAESRLMEVEQEKAKIRREQTMEAVLAPLSGTKREQMRIILSNVETDRLQECYNLFIGRVLKEDTQPAPQVIAEAAKVEQTTEVVTGNEPGEEKITEAVDERLLRLAGIR
jgi:hypothetical protein